MVVIKVNAGETVFVKRMASVDDGATFYFSSLLQ